MPRRGEPVFENSRATAERRIDVAALDDGSSLHVQMGNGRALAVEKSIAIWMFVQHRRIGMKRLGRIKDAWEFFIAYVDGEGRGGGLFWRIRSDCSDVLSGEQHFIH